MQNIKLPIPCRHCVNRAGQRRVIGDINSQSFGPPTCNANLGRDGFGATRIKVRHHHQCAFGRHCQRPGPTDARPGPVTKATRLSSNIPNLQAIGQPPGLRPRCKIPCATIRLTSDTASTMVPMALISGVTPRRIEENT